MLLFVVDVVVAVVCHMNMMELLQIVVIEEVVFNNFEDCRQLALSHNMVDYPRASSSAVMPNDQISALQLYPSLVVITSGAIQNGVPTNVRFRVIA